MPRNGEGHVADNATETGHNLAHGAPESGKDVSFLIVPQPFYKSPSDIRPGPSILRRRPQPQSRRSTRA